MKKRNIIMRGKLITCLTIAACMACSLTGCGKTDSISDEVKQIESDGTQSAEKDGSQTEGTSTESMISFQKGALSESLGMKNGTWEDTISIGEPALKEVQINVEVELPDTDHMCVVDLERKDISESQVKEIIGKLFNNGKVGVLEESRYPRWKLEQLIAEYEARVSAEKDDKELPEGWLERHKTELENYRAQLVNATNEMLEPDEYGTGSFWGMIGDEEWQFDIWNSSESGYSISAEMGDYAGGITTNLTTHRDYLDFWDAEDSTENACTLTKEDAVRQAAAYLSELGYGEYTVKKVVDMEWAAGQYGEDTEERFVEGYIVCFGRTIDGVQIKTETEKYILDNPPDTASMLIYRDEEAWVSITDAGVINFTVQEPRMLKPDSVTETPLLSFDRIQDSIRACISRRGKEDYFHPDGRGVVELDHMDLVYMVLTDDGLTVIPVWRIYSLDERFSSDSIDNYILINAIDGSEIDYLSEYYEMMPYEEWEE